MGADNYRFRVLKPLAEVLGVPTELPGHAPYDGAAGPENGIGEGHPGAPAAFEAGHSGQRVHAGATRERPGDGRFGVRDADERRGKSIFDRNATKRRKCCSR